MNGKNYLYLTNTFFEGDTRSQIDNVYRDREEKPEKVVEYKRALRCGDCRIVFKALTKYQINKIVELGVIELINYLD